MIGVGDEDPAEVVRSVVQRAAVGGVDQAGAGEGGVEHVPDDVSLIARFSVLNRRWNNSGDRGGHRHSCGRRRATSGTVPPGSRIRRMTADSTSASPGRRPGVFPVGLGGGDLQQRHDLAGAGQPVLDQAVVADFQQFLDPAAGEAQDFHGRPGPERVVVFVAEVAALARGWVAGPDLPGGPGGGPGQRLARGGECLAGRGLAGGLQERGGVLAPLVDGPGQHRQDRQPFAGPRVHPGLAVPRELAQADLFLADRARGDPRAPPARVLDRPLGQVEVKARTGVRHCR